MSKKTHQSGSALIVSLIVLLLVTILGVSSMQSTTIQERMTGNTRQSHLSFHAAEAGVRAIESQLPLSPVDCNGFISSFFNDPQTIAVDSGQFVTPNANELPATFHSAYCGPMKKEFINLGSGLTNQAFSEIYTVVSVGSVGPVETRLISTFAIEVN
ncbi:hypothetical protein DN062_13130 [Nitrincola tibetensis]|uniref:Type 4 fimbrial biogenesis protein PilX N-terminal domain-containing protein n=1 Tax=Nitrincola tibetensis TaxID=2219697 RepID=A0A364NK04_9GAMM|nr:PilX N-terminal domain-containing pilus assembly protein [Nitrincola tibetensis]RAU17361.1 hypothetical protein DN062_13130 [Nitrincola tibetensis]